MNLDAAPPDAIPRRRIGRTDLSITQIGFGTGSLAGLFAPISDEQGRATIREALRLGISYFDTSPFYGCGRSEHILGDVLRETKANVVLSTKVGRLLEPYWAMSRSGKGGSIRSLSHRATTIPMTASCVPWRTAAKGSA